MENEVSTQAAPPDLQPRKPSGQNSTLILTAAIFFAMGFIIASLAFSGGSDESLNVQEAVDGTFLALTPTITPTPTAIPVAQTYNDDNPVLGDIDAPIVMVEFSSYTCGFCGRFRRETLPALQEHYGDMFTFVVRDFPRSEGEIVLNAMARCAHDQDPALFWSFTDLFWQNQVEEQLPLNDQTLSLFATRAELDVDQLNTCLADDSVLTAVVEDRQAGIIWGVTGTPAFFINGVPVSGAQPFEYFQFVIDGLLIEQGIDPPSQT